jgi:hypothetical protein
MNRSVLGLVGGSVVVAAVWWAFAPPHHERVRAEAKAVSPRSTSERSSERSQVLEKRTDETTAEVSRAVRAGIADAVGEARVRLRDQEAAAIASAEATPIDPPNGFRTATPEEEEKFRLIRQALGETPEKEANE